MSGAMEPEDECPKDIKIGKDLCDNKILEMSAKGKEEVMARKKAPISRPRPKMKREESSREK